MYIVPQPYKCDKCGHEQKWGPDERYSYPVFNEEKETSRGIVTTAKPVCPVCFEKFIVANVGLLRCTIDWDGSGSDYRNAKEAQFIDDREYSKKWDAMYSKSEDRWLEAQCGQDDCEYCADRPVKPSDDINLY